MSALCKTVVVALRYAPLFIFASAVPAGAAAGPTATQVIEKAAIRAVDLREEARFVKFEGVTYHLKAPTIIPLSPSGALISGQVSRVHHYLNPDEQYYYRLQVDSQGRVMSMYIREPVGKPEHHNRHVKEVNGLLLTGSLDGVLTRAGSPKDWFITTGPIKLALGVGWAYVRAAASPEH